ncbi:hypothetical protein CALVIDRAFT_596280 [Calocera viscosa TUFC12733]|uniref:Uncharacterized protein n=1 Tax=Calocera viscosa (strain TUFC12733) TaxID=1330018 RepID=A0A167PW52_CALVF|nr:hypothetical protein CALVIDRAFT_596280 [Calocera viscosa TUFC12733]
MSEPNRSKGKSTLPEGESDQMGDRDGFIFRNHLFFFGLLGAPLSAERARAHQFGRQVAGGLPTERIDEWFDRAIIILTEARHAARTIAGLPSTPVAPYGTPAQAIHTSAPRAVGRGAIETETASQSTAVVGPSGTIREQSSTFQALHGTRQGEADILLPLGDPEAQQDGLQFPEPRTHGGALQEDPGRAHGPHDYEEPVEDLQRSTISTLSSSARPLQSPPPAYQRGFSLDPLSRPLEDGSSTSFAQNLGPVAGPSSRSAHRGIHIPAPSRYTLEREDPLRGQNFTQAGLEGVQNAVLFGPTTSTDAGHASIPLEDDTEAPPTESNAVAGPSNTPLPFQSEPDPSDISARSSNGEVYEDPGAPPHVSEDGEVWHGPTPSPADIRATVPSPRSTRSTPLPSLSPIDTTGTVYATGREEEEPAGPPNTIRETPSVEPDALHAAISESDAAEDAEEELVQQALRPISPSQSQDDEGREGTSSPPATSEERELLKIKIRRPAATVSADRQHSTPPPAGTVRRPNVARSYAINNQARGSVLAGTSSTARGKKRAHSEDEGEDREDPLSDSEQPLKPVRAMAKRSRPFKKAKKQDEEEDQRAPEHAGPSTLSPVKEEREEPTLSAGGPSMNTRSRTAQRQTTVEEEQAEEEHEETAPDAGPSTGKRARSEDEEGVSVEEQEAESSSRPKRKKARTQAATTSKGRGRGGRGKRGGRGDRKGKGRA